MKTIFISTLLLVIVTTFAQAPSIEWQKAFGGSSNEYLKSGYVTSDGGCLAFGNTSSENGMVTNYFGGYDCWVVKLSAAGQLEWQKNLGGTGFDVAHAVSETSDGGYILIGYTQSNNYDVSGHYGASDAWVVKLGSTGEIEWQKCLGGSSTDYGFSIEQTSDEGFILSGQTYSTNGIFSSGQGGWIIKMDNSGNIQWQKKIGSYQTTINSVHQTNDGGYIGAGFINGPIGGRDYIVIKLNGSGETIWQKYYGGTGSDMAESIKQTTDGGYIVSGTSESSNTDVTQNNGSFDIWVVKLDELGNIQWQKALGGPEHEDGNSIAQTSDGRYITCGKTSSNSGMVSGNHGDADYWVVKLDDEGNVLWQKAIGGTGFEDGKFVAPSTDGGFFVAGSTSGDFGEIDDFNGGNDFWVVKLGPENLGIDDISSTNDMKIYPNPVKNILQIKSESIVSKIEIFDYNGRMVGSKMLNNNQADVSDLPRGNYLLKLYSDQGTQNIKMIKE